MPESKFTDKVTTNQWGIVDNPTTQADHANNAAVLTNLAQELFAGQAIEQEYSGRSI